MPVISALRPQRPVPSHGASAQPPRARQAPKARPGHAPSTAAPHPPASRPGVRPHGSPCRPAPAPASLGLCGNYQQPAACPELSALDRALEALMPLAQHLPSWEPGNSLLAEARRRQVDALVARLSPEVSRLTPGVIAHDPKAIAAYDALVQGAVHTLRSTPLPGGNAVLELWDRLVYQPGSELSDSPACPMAERAHVLDTLDRLNEHADSYKRWARLLAPMIARAQARRRQPHIVDLAAGAGGFAIALKRTLGDAVRVTATDLVPAYLELGRQHAAAEGLQVQFTPQDATHLSRLAGRQVDVFTATQCLHHFPPGMAARMLGEAVRAATIGVCFIDGERGAIPAALMGAFMALYGRRWPVVHDTLVSFRRMYVAEEMRLLALLAPTGSLRTQVDSGRLPPGHGYVMLQRAVA